MATKRKGWLRRKAPELDVFALELQSRVLFSRICESKYPQVFGLDPSRDGAIMDVTETCFKHFPGLDKPAFSAEGFTYIATCAAQRVGGVKVASFLDSFAAAITSAANAVRGQPAIKIPKTKRSKKK